MNRFLFPSVPIWPDEEEDEEEDEESEGGGRGGARSLLLPRTRVSPPAPRDAQLVFFSQAARTRADLLHSSGFCARRPGLPRGELHALGAHKHAQWRWPSRRQTRSLRRPLAYYGHLSITGTWLGVGALGVWGFRPSGRAREGRRGNTAEESLNPWKDIASSIPRGHRPHRRASTRGLAGRAHPSALDKPNIKATGTRAPATSTLPDTKPRPEEASGVSPHLPPPSSCHNRRGHGQHP